MFRLFRISPLTRKALRDLWLMRGQALAIALVIAAGIAMLVMSRSTLDSLRTTRDMLYAEQRFSHVWAHLKRAPETLAQRVAEVPGVAEVDTRIGGKGMGGATGGAGGGGQQKSGTVKTTLKSLLLRAILLKAMAACSCWGWGRLKGG